MKKALLLIILVLLTVSASAEPISPRDIGSGIWEQIVHALDVVTAPLVAAVESVTTPEPEEPAHEESPPRIDPLGALQECGTPQECIDEEAFPRIDPLG